MQIEPMPEREGWRCWLSSNEEALLVQYYSEEPRKQVAIELMLDGLRSEETTRVTKEDFRKLDAEAEAWCLRVRESKTGYRECPVSRETEQRTTMLANARGLRKNEPLIDGTFDSVDDRQIERDSLRVELGGDRSDTVLEAEDFNTLNKELIGAHQIDGGYKFQGGRRRWFTNTRIIERDSIEAIQVSTIYGGFTKVARRVAEFARAYDDLRFLDEVLGWTFKVGGRELNDIVDELPDFVRSVVAPDFTGLIAAVAAAPNIFTFTEFTVFADGRRVIRLWDASRFPRHVMYVDGTMPVSSSASTNLSYQPRERVNLNFIAFLAEAATRKVTPYYAPEHAYKMHVLHNSFADTVEDVYNDIIDWIPGVDPDGYPDYTDLSSTEGIGPLQQFGFTADDQPLGEDEIDQITPFLPHWPF